MSARKPEHGHRRGFLAATVALLLLSGAARGADTECAPVQALLDAQAAPLAAGIAGRARKQEQLWQGALASAER